MTKRVLVFLTAALTLGPELQRVLAQPLGNEQYKPFTYSQGFESGTDPVQFWTSYKKKYTVNFKGLTDEKARSGKRSFKLDVTFDQTSRFLWHIPMARKVPAAGELQFSGHLLLGEGTTAEATLGVSFALPPTRHTGCTAWGPLLRSTDGAWRVQREDVIERAERVAKTIVRRHHWGVKGENVGPLMESIIVDVRAKAGQRVVLYVDDLEVKGSVPSNEAYRAEAKRRWAPVTGERDQKVSSWNAALREVDAKLSALRDLSPQAEGMRRDTMARAKEVKAVVAEAKARDSLRRRYLTEVESFLKRVGNARVNIEAVSAAERAGQRALVYVVPPISSVMILPHDRYVPGKPSREISLAAARGEYEPASFVLSAMSSIRSLTVAVSDLRSDRGEIPATRVDVKAVKCWYQSGSAWVGNQQDRSKRLLIPELLLNDDTLVRVDEEKKENYLKLSFPDGPRYEWISDPTEITRSRSLPVDEFPVKDSPVLLPVDIPAGRSKQFWLTVHVPIDAKPGTYTGTIALNTPGGTLGKLTLTLDVRPLSSSLRTTRRAWTTTEGSTARAKARSGPGSRAGSSSEGNWRTCSLTG